jgi:ankyrin repeat protein
MCGNPNRRQRQREMPFCYVACLICVHRLPLHQSSLGISPVDASFSKQINIPDSDGRTALHWAAHQNNYKMLKFLVQHGAVTGLRDSADRTPLHLATAAESSKCVRMLLKVTSPELIDAVDVDGMTALHWCAAHDHPKHLDALVRVGADIRAKDNDLKTALHWCTGHLETLTASLLLHADPTLVQEQDTEGRTTLHLALSEQNMALAGLLLDSMAPEQLAIEDNMRRTALHWAAVLGIVDAVSILVQYGLDPLVQDDVGATPLHYAAQNESGECVQILLEVIGSAADATPDQEGRTVLMWASSQDNTEAMEMLAAAGVDIHARDNSGGTAFHVAAYSGKENAIKLLLDMGSMIDDLDNQVRVMHLACSLFFSFRIGGACVPADALLTRISNILLEPLGAFSRVRDGPYGHSASTPRRRCISQSCRHRRPHAAALGSAGWIRQDLPPTT